VVAEGDEMDEDMNDVAMKSVQEKDTRYNTSENTTEAAEAQAIQQHITLSELAFRLRQGEEGEDDEMMEE
jgi:hypothetical protein